MNNQLKFGVWMDSQQAVIVGSDASDNGMLVIKAKVNGEEISPSGSENNEHNQKKSLQLKYFKEIAAHMQNATHVHLTGTGIVQEQFMHFLADTPQFKNTPTSACTSNRMSDEKLVEFMQAKLN
jgi:stalled ribosome rescue protein Dom34